ncbi:MAG: 4-hydroxy-3-methylbut-2-enyl diphosphate reductase [Lachnospiraceae bacterium]|nr:4-hydroxy-3-methylbut-2-enyl diphosphate reductase [Lachnospiraceae bacterium]
MREVILAKHAGFCFGVRRAVELLEKELQQEDRQGSLHTWGPIIHNDTVVGEFAARGVSVIGEVSGLGEGDRVVVRAHGIPKDVGEAIAASGAVVIDATCPFVKRIHEIVARESAEGRTILVVGDPKHPEVQGIVSWADPERGGVIVLETPEDARRLDLPAGCPVTVVAQTTFRVNKFQEIVEIVRGKEYDVNVADTVCNATGERQREAESLAAGVDAMIVVGDAASSNTRKLYEICSAACPHTYYVHTPADLPDAFPEGVSRVGITAGASTPQKIIEEVVKYVRSGQEFH